MKVKPIRIATNKNVPESCSEYIDIRENGVMFYNAVDDTLVPNSETRMSVPCSVEDVEEFFAMIGRDFDRSRLPPGTVLRPYESWI
jgi:hypothetical protein